MARTGFSAIDIYLYTDGMVRDCGAFSCSCGGGSLRCCVYEYISRLVPCGGWCWCSGVYMYLCIMRLPLVWWWWSAHVYMDRYIMVVRSCLRLCVSIG